MPTFHVELSSCSSVHPQHYTAHAHNENQPFDDVILITSWYIACPANPTYVEKKGAVAPESWGQWGEQPSCPDSTGAAAAALCPCENVHANGINI